MYHLHVCTAARVLERKYGHICVHTGGVSNPYSRIRTARARVHCWVGTETQRRHRVHGEATECVVFIGRAWTEQAMETRPGVPQNGGNGLVFDRPRSKRDPIHWEGSGVPQSGGNKLVLERYGRNGGSCSSGEVCPTTKRDSTSYCPSTMDSL